MIGGPQYYDDGTLYTTAAPVGVRDHLTWGHAFLLLLAVIVGMFVYRELIGR